jgi:hypothetical protein
MAIRFLKSLDTRRAGLAADAFAPAVTLKRARKMLGTRGHGWVEWLPDASSTRVFGDRDVYIDLPITDEAAAAAIEAQTVVEERKLRNVLDGLRAGIREAVRATMRANAEEEDVDEAHVHAVTEAIGYKIATRHGKAPDGRYKLSFRPFFYGVRIAPYSSIPALFDMAWAFSGMQSQMQTQMQTPAKDAMAAFWDFSVYKAGDQLLAAVNGAKNPTGYSAGRGKPRVGKDTRVLEMEHPATDDVLDYVAQHVDEAWPLLRMSPKKVASRVRVSGELESNRATTETTEDVRYAVELTACLSAARSANRKEWIDVGHVLKYLAGEDDDSDEAASPLYAAFLAFSRLAGRAGGYKGDDDCGRTWDGFKPRGAVGIGSLVTFAKADDPDRALTAWRAHKERIGDAGSSTSNRVIAREGGIDAAEQRIVVDLVIALGDADLARMDPARTSYVQEGNTVRLACPVSGVTCSVDCTTSLVRRHDGSFVGQLYKDVPVQRCLRFVNPMVPPDARFVANRPSETAAVFTTVAGSATPCEIVYNNIDDEPNSRGIVVRQGTVTKDVTASKKTQAMHAAYYHSVGTHARDLGVPAAFYINHVEHLVVHNGNGGGGDASNGDFDKIRDKLEGYAEERRLLKADGAMYAPVEGCRCAYAEMCSYADYINLVLAGDPVYKRNPRRFKEAMEFLENYREIPTFAPDLDLLSFANGVLRLSDATFTPYADITDPAAFGIARHHVAAEYTGSVATPLLDRIAAAQGWEPDVAELMYALLGRLLFKVNHLDRWEVMPYLVGVGGSGKSLVLKVVSAMFRRSNAVGNLAARREEVFGLDNIARKEVVVGRDMPAKLSGVIAQEMMQCMTTGDDMEIAIKGKRSENVTWSAPVIMASNHTPDYVNTGDNVGRRLVMFRFDRVVAEPQTDLQPRILAEELPAVVARCVGAYAALRARVGCGGDLWRHVPPVVREWRGRLAAATSKLHRFLEAATNGGDADDTLGVYVEREEGAVTWASDFRQAFERKHGMGSFVMDVAAFTAFGFAVSDKTVNMCLSCKHFARARPTRCCENYSAGNRRMQVVISGMRIGMVVPEPPATTE